MDVKRETGCARQLALGLVSCTACKDVETRKGVPAHKDVQFGGNLKECLSVFPSSVFSRRARVKRKFRVVVFTEM